jgi:hypothetical protein
MEEKMDKLIPKEVAKLEKKVDEKISSVLTQSNTFATTKVTTAVKNLATKVAVDAVGTKLSKLQSAILLDISALEGSVLELRAKLTNPAKPAQGRKMVRRKSRRRHLKSDSNRSVR